MIHATQPEVLATSLLKTINKSRQIYSVHETHHSALCLARECPWKQFQQHLKQLNNTQ